MMPDALFIHATAPLGQSRFYFVFFLIYRGFNITLTRFLCNANTKVQANRLFIHVNFPACLYPFLTLFHCIFKS